VEKQDKEVERAFSVKMPVTLVVSHFGVLEYFQKQKWCPWHISYL
jgi:hypothetical protein